MDHHDDYKKMFTPNAAAGPSTFPLKNQGGGKGKGGGKKGKGRQPYKGKGKQCQNAAEQTAQIIKLQGDSDNESDAGSVSNIPETGWSMLTQSQLAAESTLRSVCNDLARRKRDDEDYACRLARPWTPDDRTIKYCDDGFVHDQYNNESFDCYTLCTSKESDDKCPCLSSNHSGQKTESHCPKHKHLDGLWLMDSGETDHSHAIPCRFLDLQEVTKTNQCGYCWC